VALCDAIQFCISKGVLSESPIINAVAAVSVGMYQGVAVLDLDYPEDSNCDTDMNVVMDGNGGFIEVQGTAEGAAFSRDQLNTLLALAEKGVAELLQHQQEALKA
jgi:ribonuclease PH